MIQINNPIDCCGCTACASICAHEAINMKPDALGFLYPVVDKEKCVDCGLCDKVCAFNDNYDSSLNLSSPEAYGARHKNLNEVETSRSGASFIAISDWILEHCGVVYGVGYTDHFRVVHKRAVNKGERDEFKGSKYVQSDLCGVFRQVKQDLKEGRMVLFTGTPCQTAGLNSFVGKKLRPNLYLVDIICHGVPSPFVWRDYIEYLEEKKEDEILHVNFRNKQKYGWSAHRETFTFKNGGELDLNYWHEIFYQHIIFRKSCGKCHFCNTKRPSDITLGDFWGWEKNFSNINADDKGLSLVLLNTEKGKQLWTFIQKDMNSYGVAIERCMQPNLKRPSIMHARRNKLERDYQARGFNYIYQQNYNNKVIDFIYYVIQRFLQFFKSY